MKDVVVSDHGRLHVHGAPNQHLVDARTLEGKDIALVGRYFKAGLVRIPLARNYKTDRLFPVYGGLFQAASNCALAPKYEDGSSAETGT